MWGSSSSVPPDFPSPDGLEVVVDGPSGLVRGQVRVTDAIRGASGHVHNGVLAGMAVSRASSGTSRAIAGSGRVGVAVSMDMYFLEVIHPLRFLGEATVRNSGPTEWIWDVDIADDPGRLCAMGRVTVWHSRTRGGRAGRPVGQ